jgi:hypothetical protein
MISVQNFRVPRLPGVWCSLVEKAEWSRVDEAEANLNAFG